MKSPENVICQNREACNLAHPVLTVNRRSQTPFAFAQAECYQGPLFSRTRQNQELEMPKVLISDKMNKLAEDIFKARGVDVDVKTGLKPDELKAIIGAYDGLAIRSSTTVTPEILEAATNLKVVGRAGIGVDNVDIKAATAKGVIVMNTPFGNSITTAEHAIAMMFALARDIPQASESTHAGKWEKNKFMGVELYNKTLGVIGCGNIGSIVADRALGLKMNVIAYDPFLSEEKAVELGVKKVELEQVFTDSDFITLHVPKNEKTKGIIDKNAIAKMKKGVRIINCARGGLIVEADLKEALDSGKVAGAALDVFDTEPATKDTTSLLGHEKVICTPHLGASTDEAQVNVAIQVAEQISDFLMTGAVTNALNTPSISAEDAPRLKPYLKLAEQLGSFAGQITESGIKSIGIAYDGAVSEINTKPLTAAIVAKLLQPVSDSVNMVNAMTIADSKGIRISETKSGSQKDFRSLITVTIQSEVRTRTVAGTLFTGREPRIVNIEGVPIEAALAKDMLFIRNEDKPGLIGALGTILGNAKQNIADFRLGRMEGADSAVCLISLDAPLPDGLFKEVSSLPQVKTAKRLSF
jgi:D-3-phosphoglycerate dehydrogenase